MELLDLSTIWDISTWERDVPNRWGGWAVPACPVELEEDKIKLLNHLAGLAPLAKCKKDRRGWGSGKYTALAGYQKFAASYNVPANPKKWNILWKCSTIPKIDIFIWTLLHEKILTGRIWLKRDLLGRSAAPFVQKTLRISVTCFLIVLMLYQFGRTW